MKKKIDTLGDVIEKVKEFTYKHYFEFEPIWNTRKKPQVDARRFITGYIQTRYPQVTLQKIADHFGGQNHATVLNLQRTFNDLFSYDKNYKMQYLLYEAQLDNYLGINLDALELQEAINALQILEAYLIKKQFNTDSLRIIKEQLN